MKTVTTLLVMTGLVLSGQVIADTQKYHAETEIQRKDDGSYTAKDETKITDAAGTTRESAASEKLDIDEDGGTKAKVTVKNSVDPKGAFNETYAKKSKVVKKDSEGDIEVEARARSVDALGTGRRSVVTKETEVHDDGTARTTITKKKVVDPKGLLNKEKTEKETVIDRNADGTTEVEKR